MLILDPESLVFADAFVTIQFVQNWTGVEEVLAQLLVVAPRGVGCLQGVISSTPWIWVCFRQSKAQREPVRNLPFALICCVKEALLVLAMAVVA